MAFALWAIISDFGPRRYRACKNLTLNGTILEASIELISIQHVPLQVIRINEGPEFPVMNYRTELPLKESISIYISIILC